MTLFTDICNRVRYWCYLTDEFLETITPVISHCVMYINFNLSKYSEMLFNFYKSKKFSVFFIVLGFRICSKRIFLVYLWRYLPMKVFE